MPSSIRTLRIFEAYRNSLFETASCFRSSLHCRRVFWGSLCLCGRNLCHNGGLRHFISSRCGLTARTSFHLDLEFSSGKLIQKRTHSCVAGLVVASRQHPCADRGLLKKDLELSSVDKMSPGASPAVTGTTSVLTCGLVSQLDVFAQSRVTNYAKRICTSPVSKSSSSVCLAKPLYSLKKIVRMDLQIPVELFYGGSLERSQITATGFAELEKDAFIAACMHAERCLDALSIPLFSAAGRQKKRVEELRREGRWSPMPQDPPQEFSTDNIPPCICFVSSHLLPESEKKQILHSPGGEGKEDSARNSSGHGAAVCGGASGEETASKKRSSGPTRFTRLAGEKPFQNLSTAPYGGGGGHPRSLRRQRSKDFSRRFGSDPFLNSFNEMQNLYQTILQHQQSSSDAEEEDDVPVAIETHEIEILQPSRFSSSDTRKSSSSSSAALGGSQFEGTEERFSSFSSNSRRGTSNASHTATANGHLHKECHSNRGSGPLGTSHASSSPPSFRNFSRPSPGSINFIGSASTDNSPNRSYYIPSHFNCADETEGGQFKLVDVSIDKWLPERKNPICVCIRDSTVHERLKEHWEQHLLEGAEKTSSFDECVEVTKAEQEANIQQNGRWRTVLLCWYTASVVVPGLFPSKTEKMDDASSSVLSSCSSAPQMNNPPRKLIAIGKATTLDAAKDLCAMHAEELLNFFGIPLSSNPETQLTHFDGCLRWGRFAAPEPVPFEKGIADPNLPLPNKEWYVPRKARLRVSPMTVTEKLQALNRRVVSQYRQHHIEVDLLHFRQYDGVMAASPVCLRDFMLSQQHPFECAIMNFHLAPNEFRASVYLPLPAEYGVRGGCAVGRTEEIAYHLCAMNAMDVLFALDCVPTTLLERPRWQDYLKERANLGMILPLSYRVTLQSSSEREDGEKLGQNAALFKPSPSLRSPPGIRDAPNSWSSEIPPSDQIWKVLMTNADDFDVVPDPAHIPALQGLEVVNLLRRMFTRFLRGAASGYDTGSMRTTSTGLNKKSLDNTDESSSRDLRNVKKVRSPSSSLAPAGPLKCLRHYCGYQHQNGIRRVRANSCWLELPLDKSLYGHRIAYGRCLTRNGAERAFFIHAFRILRSLRAAPWEEWSEAELRQRLYGEDELVMKKEIDFWRLLVKHVLDPSPLLEVEEGNASSHPYSSSSGLTGGSELSTAGRGKHQVPVAELVVTERDGNPKNSTPVVDISTPSPNPVMTPQLASLTFL